MSLEKRQKDLLARRFIIVYISVKNINKRGADESMIIYSASKGDHLKGQQSREGVKKKERQVWATYYRLFIILRSSHMIRIFLVGGVLLGLAKTIDQQCSYPSLTNTLTSNLQVYEPCPANSYCTSTKYCACDSGFIGNCTTPAFRMEDDKQISSKVTSENYTLFEVLGDSDMLTLLSFSLCHVENSSNSELIDVWGDNGKITEFTHSSAEPGGKSYSISEGCINLNTPFMQFGTKSNGEVEGFIFGMKLTSPGEITAKLTVTIELLDFWGLMTKLLIIIGSFFFLTLAMAIGYLVYKWRRRRNIAIDRNRPNNLDHFQKYMPRQKYKRLNQTIEQREQHCSVCLLEMGDESYVRKTICGHVFHQECLDQWCRNKMSCPICRKSLEMDGMREVEASLIEGSDRTLRENIL